MKYFVSLVLSFVLLVVSTYTTDRIVHTPQKSSVEQVTLVKLKSPQIYKRRKGLQDFLNHMGRIEGLGRYDIVSRSGYLGRYQFSPKTLAILGVKVTRSEFLNNPALQDSVMILWMRDNARSLRGLISKYNGTYYNGVYITKAGILAGAHLVGPGGVLAFFYPDRYSYRTRDGNGVSVAEYMTKFSHYDLRQL